MWSGLQYKNSIKALAFAGVVCSAAAHGQTITLKGQIECGPTATGAPAYVQALMLKFEGGYAVGETETGETLENQELVIDADQRARYNAVGIWKNQPQRRWRIHATGRLDSGSIQLSGSMYGDRAQDLVRKSCTIKLDAPSELILPKAKSDAFKVETHGEALGVSPSSLPGGATFREWGLEQGMPWSYKVVQSGKGRELAMRDPSSTERALANDARQVLAQTRSKAFVFIDAGKVVMAMARPGISAQTILPSASMSKSVTALGVGKAICAGHLNLTTTAQSLLPELAGKDIGQATLRDILLMSSRSSETETQHTHGITAEETRQNLANPNRSVRDLVAEPRIAKARFAKPTFDYKSTDPYLAALMTQQATGVAFTKWVREQIFDEARLGELYVLDSDRKGNFLSTGGVKMALSDWARLAIYIQEQRDQPTCFGQFIRDLGRTQIAIPKIPGVNGYFSGYGFLTWTDNDMVPSTAWAVGAYGQRIGWSIKERNTKVFLSFGDGSDPDMNKIYPLANRWINF